MKKVVSGLVVLIIIVAVTLGIVLFPELTSVISGTTGTSKKTSETETIESIPTAEVYGKYYHVEYYSEGEEEIELTHWMILEKNGTFLIKIQRGGRIGGIGHVAFKGKYELNGSEIIFEAYTAEGNVPEEIRQSIKYGIWKPKAVGIIKENYISIKYDYGYSYVFSLGGGVWHKAKE